MNLVTRHIQPEDAIPLGSVRNSAKAETEVTIGKVLTASAASEPAEPSATSAHDFAAARETPQSAEVRRQLHRILANPSFRVSRRLTSFLAFVVEATLAGKGNRIKSYTIAVEAFGRDPSFDPQNDAIVRVEAGRLREALARYYLYAGSDDPVVIDLPRGSYVPLFRRRIIATPAVPVTRSEQVDRVEGNASARPVSIAVDRATLMAVFKRLIELRSRQIEAMNAEIEIAREMLERSTQARLTRD